MAWQPAAILYPDVELELTAAMRSLLPADVWVDRKVPSPRQDRMAIFIRDGGTSSNFRDRARVRCLAWATTDQAATDLARQIVALIQRIVDGVTFVHVDHISGPYEIADDSRQPCRYLLFDVQTYGSETP